MGTRGHQSGWHLGAAVRRLLVLAAFSVATLGFLTPPAATAYDAECSTSRPFADIPHDRAQAAVQPQKLQELKAAPKQRDSGRAAPSQQALVQPAQPTAPAFVLSVRLGHAAAGTPPARRTGDAQPRAPPAIRI